MSFLLEIENKPVCPRLFFVNFMSRRFRKKVTRLGHVRRSYEIRMLCLLLEWRIFITICFISRLFQVLFRYDHPFLTYLIFLSVTRLSFTLTPTKRNILTISIRSNNVILFWDNLVDHIQDDLIIFEMRQWPNE